MPGPNTPYFYRSGGGSSSGATGTGLKNYLTTYKASTGAGVANTGNGDIELGATTGFVMGNVGSLTNGLPTGTSPTFGSGSSGNLSIATANTNTLGGLFSLDIISSAATTLADCVATAAFNIDSEDQGKVLGIKIAYKAQTNPTNGNWSGTSSNSYGLAVWDATNSIFLPVVGAFNFVQSSGVGYATATVQTGITTASMRLIIYNVNASSNAITLRTDDWFIGPQVSSIAPAVSDWISYTPTSSWVANTTVTGKWRRVGDTMQGFIDWTLSGAPTSANLTFTLPTGYSIDTTKIPGAAQQGVNIFGYGGGLHAAGGTGNFLPSYGSSATTLQVEYQASTAAATSVVNATTPFTWANTDKINVYFEVPIVGWSSNAVSSADSDTRLVAARMTGATATVTGSYSDVTWTTIANDTHGAMGAISYTVPVTGYYDISGALNVGATTLSAAGGFFVGFNNGSVILENQFLFDLNVPENESLDFNYGSVLLNAGTTFKIQIKTSGTVGTPVINSSATTNFLAIKRLSGPAVVQAIESVNMKYVNTAGTSMANSGENNVPFATKIFDTHNAFSGTVFTCPVSGKYRVSGNVGFTSSTYASGNQIQASVYKNSSLESEGIIQDMQAAITISVGINVTTLVSCNAGDTLEVRVLNNRTAGATSLSSATGQNHICIERVGN